MLIVFGYRISHFLSILLVISSCHHACYYVATFFGPTCIRFEVMSLDKFPSLPRFHWEIRNAPWTDGRGPQDVYIAAVMVWKFLHGNLDH